MPIFLGIDGGGTKTSCLIGNDTSTLGSGTGAGSNLIRVDESQAREALASAIRQACAAARVDPRQITRTCVGSAGAARPEISAVVQRLVAEIVSGEVEVVGDMVVALEAAFAGGPGVIVIAGTGSIAHGRNRHGQTVRAGGWGFAISDEGSGYWIGRAAVAAALRAFDENQLSPDHPHALLLAAIVKSWHLETHDQIVLAGNAIPPPDFAALLPAVLSAADAGDSVARAVLHQAGAELAALATIVIHRLFAGADSVPVALSGGVFRNGAIVRQIFYNSLRSSCPGAVVNPDVVDPVRGALELARQGARKGRGSTGC